MLVSFWHWRQLSQTLRDQGRFEEAVAVCQLAWPQWQSFDYAARVMRAAIRDTETSSVAHQQWLRKLLVQMLGEPETH